MKTLGRSALFAIMTAILAAGSVPAMAQAVVPTPITAEQAFDAVMSQTDPLTAQHKFVILVDVRTAAEYYWVGTAAMVQSITLDDETVITPDLGKVQLIQEGSALLYHVDGHLKIMQTRKVTAMKLASIAYHVPFQTWNETTGKSESNENFGATMALLAGTSKPVVILFCRSGHRSGAEMALTKMDPSLFDAIYEIDQPDGTSNSGGLEGSAYTYNGYRGFPERQTQFLAHPSVSWKDAGLPIVTNTAPAKVVGPAQLP